MRLNNLYLLFCIIASLVLSACSQKEKPSSDQDELFEVTGIVSGYDKDVMFVRLLRSGKVHPLRVTEQTKMDIFPAPKDTVVIVYTGYIGFPIELPVAHRIRTRPFIETGSKVVNLKELKENGGELITR